MIFSSAFPFRKSRSFAIFGLVWIGVASAQPGNIEPKASVLNLPEVQLATAALRDKLPEVATVKLRRLLDQGILSASQRRPVMLLLAESLVRAGRATEALKLTEDASLAALPEGKFWRALAMALASRWGESEALLDELGNVKDFKYAEETALSHAGMLAALGDRQRASQLVLPFMQPPDRASAPRARLWLADLYLSSGQLTEAAALAAEAAAQSSPGTPAPEWQYLLGRIALAKGDAALADKLFTGLAADEAKASSRLQTAARLGRARALRAAGNIPEALLLLRQLVSATPLPAADLLDVAFQELELLNRPPLAEMESFLTSLAAGSDPTLKIRARMALSAALEGVADPKQAEAAWTAIPRDFPDHPLRGLALLRQAQFLTSQDRRQDAAPLLEQLRQLSPTPAMLAWTAWVAGEGEYDAAAYRAAALSFGDAAQKATDPSVKAAAGFNAALSELQSGNTNPAQSLAILDQSSVAGYKLAGAEFHLERALRMASLGDGEAISGLEAFAESLPDHPRRFDALIALAEISLRANPPRAVEATRHLTASLAAAREPWQKERASLLECYIAEAAGSTAAAGGDAFATKVEKFLIAFPQSAERTDLRMRAAQMYYRRENFSGARQLFETLAADDPGHPLAEPALFWAGRAALLSMEPTANQQAMALWEKVVARNGPLKWQARLQEALLNRLTQPAAALQLLEEILLPTATPAPEASTRWQALSVRGEILTAMDAPPASHAQGLKSFDEVINAAGLPADWFRQTLTRKGVRLEALNRSDEALEAYYDVLSRPPAGTASPQEAQGDYWFHRAGGKALALLEKAGKFEEAIEIAKKMAKAPGPRGRAAAELVNELALKYKIWISSP